MVECNGGSTLQLGWSQDHFDLEKKSLLYIKFKKKYLFTLDFILTEVGYGKQTDHTSGGLSDTFQTTGRQSDFRPNHRWV